MLLKFKEHIVNNFPELLEQNFLIACSGGLDSLVLVDLCQKTNLDFSIAHCNFGLRGNESDGDEDFVSQLALYFDRKFYVTHFDTLGYVNQHKVSVQMAARQLRYAWFSKLLMENNIPFVLTAHHANDNLETFLINLSRGTGIEGLNGIPSKTDSIRRPLLIFSREELEGYAKEQNLKWREDESNADAKYLRNKIRLEIIPKLNELHPTFLENFKNSQNYLAQNQAIASNYIEKLKKELFIHQEGKIKIDVAALSQLKPLDAFLYGLFHEYGFTEWQNISDLVNAMSGKKVRSKTHVLVKNRAYLWLSAVKDSEGEQDYYEINKNIDAIKHPVAIKFTDVVERGNNDENKIFIQKDALKYPLVLRKWQEGDYFYPLGLNRKKKLSKFFKDEKMSILDKEGQWLLCCDSQIVWVIGRRADHRYKVEENSKSILKIELAK